MLMLNAYIQLSHFIFYLDLHFTSCLGFEALLAGIAKLYFSKL